MTRLGTVTRLAKQAALSGDVREGILDAEHRLQEQLEYPAPDKAKPSMAGPLVAAAVLLGVGGGMYLLGKHNAR